MSPEQKLLREKIAVLEKRLARLETAFLPIGPAPKPFVMPELNNAFKGDLKAWFAARERS